MQQPADGESGTYLERFSAGLAFSQQIMDGSNPDLQCSNDIKLKLYGLFKQSIMGDCTQSKPDIGGRAGAVAVAKWKAHCDNKGTSRSDAMQKFVAELDALFPDWMAIHKLQVQHWQQLK